MSLDHYVPQVHLKNFYSPRLGQQMYAVRKSDLQTYQCDAYSQCRIQNGSSNPYLEEPRAIELFLKDIEPKYNSALDRLRTRNLNSDTVFTIAGFAAYVEGCSPGGMRLHQKMMEQFTESMGSLIAAKNRDGGKPCLPTLDFSDPENQVVRAKVDGKYAQSFGITELLDRLYLYGNSAWEIIENRFAGSPFFTSDFPVAIENSDTDPRFKNKIVPISPDVAVRIKVNTDYKYRGVNRFREFRYRFVEASKKDVSTINQAIVRCAENTIYHRDNLAWILPFVAKNRFFRVETCIRHLPHGERDFTVSSVEVVKHHSAET